MSQTYVTLKKKYIDINETHKLKIEVYYSRDGILALSGKRYPRGCYISVMPVECKMFPSGFIGERFALGSAIKRFLLACDAPDDPITREALNLADSVEHELVSTICRRVRIKLPTTHHKNEN